METWPVSFPPPSTSLDIQVAANTIRTNMESGLVRQRRRFTTEAASVGVEWSFSDIQMGVFIAFHKFRLNLGSDWFLMDLPLGGLGPVSHEVRFVEGKFRQQYEDVGFWRVGAELEIKERVTFSEDLLGFYIDIGFTDSELENIIVISNSFHYTIHTVLPTNLN